MSTRKFSIKNLILRTIIVGIMAFLVSFVLYASVTWGNMELTLMGYYAIIFVWLIFIAILIITIFNYYKRK